MPGDFTSLLLRISKEVEKRELKTMKICCREHGIGAARLEEISDAYDLFDELRKRNLLGPQNKERLVELLKKADRIDLMNDVLGIQGSARPRDESSSSVPDGAVASEILKDSHLNDISEDLGRDWKALGRKLEIESTILDNIDAEYRWVKEKSFQMMLRWKKRSGNNATGQALANALIARSRRDIAEKLADICRQDGIHIHTSEENRRAESGGLNTMQADLAPRLPTQECDT